MEFLTRLREFFQEVTAEFRRVNWPSRQEVAASTVVVLAVVLVLSMYLGAVDVALSRLVEVILK
ncbi:MAG TPA: preprotein translocase subunit SecE [Methylomirabilota bacterium]|jgi:preprotein translocase subunit SecE|nr:preprotein translocase subunit SecE [Methylomirabilota bacterium]